MGGQAETGLSEKSRGGAQGVILAARPNHFACVNSSRLGGDVGIFNYLDTRPFVRTGYRHAP